MRKKRAALVIIDLTVWLGSYVLFTGLRYLPESDPTPWGVAAVSGTLAALAFLGLCASLRLYTGRHQPGSLDEASLLALCGGLVSLVATMILAADPQPRVLALSIPLAAGAASVLGCFAARAAYRRHKERSHRGTGGARAVVVGAGATGSRLVRDLHLEPNRPYDPVAFVDDDTRKRHYRIGSTRVLGTVADLDRILSEEAIEHVIIAAPSGGPELVRRVNEVASRCGARTKVLPTLAEFAGQEPGFRDLRDLEFSDFLGRRQVDTGLSTVSHYLTGRRVLVTGAGGSIGSELCRQIAKFGPSQLMMLDRDESALHALQLSLDGHGLLDSTNLILADIRDGDAISAIFRERRPEVVFHAAALKHLSLLQMYPDEAVKTNVQGTLNVLRAALGAGVGVFINISTDKAADPTSVLGSSKQLAERLTAAFSRGGRYVSVRFGNVLGSRGSVLTAFAEQIQAGGPITVTHPEVTRYFMTVEEAVQLVLQAGAFGEGGDVLILDMGDPVRIIDVARQLMDLAGRHVEIVVTGLRPGEKLHEVLHGEGEALGPTQHPAISRARVEPLDPETIAAERGLGADQAPPVSPDDPDGGLMGPGSLSMLHGTVRRG